MTLTNDRPGARVPPHDLTAEESLLGAMLLTGDAVDAAAEVGLTPDAFYKPAHAHIYAAVTTLTASAHPVDPVTVSDELRRAGLLDAIGGPATLVTLQARTPATSNAGRYARIVLDHALLRSLIGAASTVTDLGYGMPDDVERALDEAEQLIHRVGAHRVRESTMADLDAVLAEVWEDLDTRVANGGAIKGVPTGHHDVDELLHGLHDSSLTVLGARPSVGKTAWALGVAAHIATVPRRPVLFCSLEMSRIELGQRLMSMRSRVDNRHLRSGQVNDADWHRLGTALNDLGGAPLIVDDDPAATVLAIRSKARRIAAQRGVAPVIVIDYLQLLASHSRPENRTQEVSAFARDLKQLARELNTPVLALSQLSRGLEQRANKRPTLPDLRESGDIEAAADVVAFLYRDELYDPETTDRGLAELIVAKHRAGPTGTVRLAWLAHHTRFADLGNPTGGTG